MIGGLAKPDDERRAVQAGLRFVRRPITFAEFEATLAAMAEDASGVRG